MVSRKIIISPFLKIRYPHLLNEFINLNSSRIIISFRQSYHLNEPYTDKDNQILIGSSKIHSSSWNFCIILSSFHSNNSSSSSSSLFKSIFMVWWKDYKMFHILITKTKLDKALKAFEPYIQKKNKNFYNY
jgi:hypothetical protein